MSNKNQSGLCPSGKALGFGSTLQRFEAFCLRGGACIILVNNTDRSFPLLKCNIL